MKSDRDPMRQTERSERSIPVPTNGHPFPLLLAHTALIVVDRQNAFCHPAGFCGGELGADLTDELQIDKPAQSIFIGTDLAKTLQQRQISHLLFTGVTTECCVLASYRQASDLGFYCLLLSDCCAAMSPIEHQAAIDVILAENGAIGWVTTADRLLDINAFS